MYKNRECIICERGLLINSIKIGKGGGENKVKIWHVSTEGIYYLQKWFCNECWKKIMKYVKNGPYRRRKKKVD